MRGVGGGPSDPGNLSMSYLVVSLLLLPTSHAVLNMGNPDAKRLYDDLLSNYNKLVRPVQNTTDPLTVRIKLKLSQLIDVVSHSPLLQHYRVYSVEHYTSYISLTFSVPSQDICCSTNIKLFYHL